MYSFVSSNFQTQQKLLEQTSMASSLATVLHYCCINNEVCEASSTD